MWEEDPVEEKMPLYEMMFVDEHNKPGMGLKMFRYMK